MIDILYLAWRYLVYHRIKSALLILSITLILFLPAGLKIVVGKSVESLSSRAEATPLLIGAKGSPLELVLNALYFESDAPPVMAYREWQRVAESGLAIPLYNRFHARKFPIVGTTLDYLDFRGLEIASGRRMAVLGECMVGADVADTLGLAAGATLISSPESVFDLAGVYPLKMQVVGILARKGTPDDRAVIVDVKTAWIIQGLAHGHQDLATPEASSAVLKRDGEVIVANASVLQYNEITPENMDSFHFHGEVGQFPISSIIVVPSDAKSGVLLQGKYLGADERVQIVKPSVVMDALLSTILTVQKYVIAAVVILGSSTLMTVALVFLLSLRLRKREIETMHRIGGAKPFVLGLLLSEAVVVLLLSAVMAVLLTAAVSRFADPLMRAFLL